MPNPRKHHYVPRCYLAGFAADSDAPRLFVLDKDSGRAHSAHVNDAACERDFYMVEVEQEGDPFAVEKLFSTVESAGAEALRFIAEHRTVPRDALYARLIAFLAVMTVRVPAVIDAIQQPFAQVMKSILWQITDSRETYEGMMEKLRSEGKDVSGVTFESMCEFVRSEDCVVSMGQNFRIGTLLEMLKHAEPLLAARKWTVVEAADGAPDFICSDRPVTLCWNKAELMHPLFGPGLGIRDTTVMFPVNRRLALLGLFEMSAPLRVLDARGVGLINMYTAFYAKRFVYSGAEDFTVNLGEGRPLAGRDGFIEAVRAAAGR